MFDRPELRAHSRLNLVQSPLGRASRLKNWAQAFEGVFVCALNTRPWFYRRLLPKIHGFGEPLAELDETAFQQELLRHRAELIRHGNTRSLLAKSFALIREAAGRTTGMYHFDSQLLGGLALFHGTIAEMQTGEGKTLTATLPAAAAALAGIPVHVITVNDYLALRDLEEMAPVYESLGLSSGCIQEGMSIEERRAIYAKDIVYCTNKELVFDYLKDQLVLEKRQSGLQLQSAQLKGQSQELEQLMLRGLHFAIVDEADSVMLDEARTPLVISADVPVNSEQVELYQEALTIAKQWQENDHYRITRPDKVVELTGKGRQTLKELGLEKGGYWRGTLRAQELIRQALSACELFERDVHYLVRDEQVQIIDEHTGRVMADRQWERGLHQLIELKEACEPSAPRQTLSRQTYQRFFNRYHHVGGMTGTAKEVASELWRVYRLPVVTIPTHKRNLRQHYGWRVLATEKDKWALALERVLVLKQQGRAVLIGCGSVGASESLSEQLQAKGLEHQLLNARQDEAEALVVAEAGQLGKITIATNMAGRGTDIKLSRAVKETGGLHVMLTECHEASRIDRQLEGRSARQGDPGSFEVIVSLEDGILQNHLLPLSVCRSITRLSGERVGAWLLRSAQRRLEKRHAAIRKQLLRQDEKLKDQMVFAANQSG